MHAYRDIHMHIQTYMCIYRHTYSYILATGEAIHDYIKYLKPIILYCMCNK